MLNTASLSPAFRVGMVKPKAKVQPEPKPAPKVEPEAKAEPEPEAKAEPKAEPTYGWRSLPGMNFFR